MYVIKSPILATSTSLPALVTTLDLFDLIIAIFVSVPSSGSLVGSLLSSPLAIATFEIVPVTSFTVTENLAITVSPDGTVTVHFIPTTVSSVSTVVFVPTISLVNSPSTLFNIIASSIDTKVVFCGILSVISISLTSISLLFVTAITYVISWPAYTNLSPPTPVIAVLFTSICGKFTFTFDFVIATSIGFHQSQNPSDTNLSCSSTLVIVVSPTSFTFVSVVTSEFLSSLLPVF